LTNTGHAKHADWSEALTAALDWWRDAGVDGTFIDDPQDWLAQTHQTSDPQSPVPMKPLRELVAERDSPPAPVVSDRSGWPQSLEGFGAWWLTEGPLAPAGLPRLAPIGAANAGLMILVPMPSADDGGTLLSGRAGRLLDAMLSAMGIPRDETYLASALPAHVPMPDWAALRAAGLGDVLLHHIALAAPKRLLILGATGVSALLGHDPTNLAHGLRAINQESSEIAAMSAWDLDAMLARPALKAGFWGRWLEWTGT
jgi:uracil-DNA glycosylase family 4